MKIQGSPCPICNRAREYVSEVNAAKGKGKPCRSCANSIKGGGVGWSPLCADCGIRAKTGKHNSQCKECHNKRSSKYHKEVYRWAKYGLNGPIAMAECEICKAVEDLVIDHCHDTQVVRGVLCRTCNMALGLLKENKNNVRSALKYAERTFNN